MSLHASHENEPILFLEPTEAALRGVIVLLLAAKQKGVKSFASWSQMGKINKPNKAALDSVWQLGQSLCVTQVLTDYC